MIPTPRSEAKQHGAWGMEKDLFFALGAMLFTPCSMPCALFRMHQTGVGCNRIAVEQIQLKRHYAPLHDRYRQQCG
jgi:hypothetical protein